jgi:chromosome partitioning protein
VLIVACASQKGGVAKSSLARLLSREFLAFGRPVLPAGRDVPQANSLERARRRNAAGILPGVAVEHCEGLKQALKSGRRAGAACLVLDAGARRRTNYEGDARRQRGVHPVWSGY